jgi:hypothetical protein
VTVSLNGVLFRFIRGRGEFTVDVAPTAHPAAWREASDVVKGSSNFSLSNQNAEYYGLNDFSRFLQANLSILQEEVGKSDWRAPRYGIWPI